MKPVCCPGDLRKIFRGQRQDTNATGDDVFINKQDEFAGLVFPQVENTDCMQREITDMKGSKIGTAEKIPDFVYPRATDNIRRPFTGLLKSC